MSLLEQTKQLPGIEDFPGIDTGESRFLILHNDDVNTFELVIETLMEVCDHEPEQAEQCAWITHIKGKCDVKKGPFERLEVMKNKMISRGLSVTIE
jgi:ATP-dependent Clp protease adaptor protein ClpS